MSDLMQWTSVLLASLGLVLWLWSGGARLPQLRRQMRRMAIFATVISALLQAAGSPALIDGRQDVELWASTVPTSLSPNA